MRKFQHRGIYRFFAFAVPLLLIFTGCSTKKDTWLNRRYHNVNARYNGYFNGTQALNEAVNTMEENYVDDYNKILPVYTYGSIKDAKTATPAMEKVFKKASFVIHRHSMMIKGSEKCSWIDDSYLLIGQSHFYRHEYFAGVEVFEYVISEFKNQESKYEAFLWLIKTYNEIGAFTKSQGYIDMIKADGAFPYRLNGELMAVTADFYSKQENYEQAAKFLNRAISYTKRKQTKARYTFILAQLYQAQKKYDLARNLYAKVIKMNPKYELVFYSRINQAKLYDASGNDSRQIVMQLNKMLKDPRNTDYNDQIYYYLAQIALKEQSNAKAIEYLKKSIETSTTNTTQKGLSSVKLADLYFEIPEYPSAGAYYDSAVAFLTKDYPDYEIVLNKKKSLGRLMRDYNTISSEDNLQRIAGMSEAERDKMIEKMMKKAREDEERMKEEAERRELDAANTFQTNVKESGTAGSTWYFYSPQQLTFGFSEFQKKWGSRKLEDHWRRSEKQVQQNTTDETQGNKPGETAARDTLGPTNSKEWYTRNLPLTAEKKEKSTLSIVEAYYDLGIVYKEQLMNFEKAAAAFEALLDKYPKCKYELTCYYQLYRLYLAMKNEQMAEKYRSILLNKYPESDYAQIIKNPSFNLEKSNRMGQIEKFYEETYSYYTEANYTEAYNRCMAADTLVAKSPFKPKFALLKSLCIGRIKPLPDFELSLKQVIADYPKDSVRIKAQEILDFIQKMQQLEPVAKASGTGDTSGVAVKYLNGLDKIHFFVLVFNDEQVNTTQLTSGFSDFNTEYFASSGLETKIIPMAKGQSMITIKTFPNGTKAMDYLSTVQSESDLFSGLAEGTYWFFIISNENYATFFKDKRTEPYMDFFAKNYASVK